MGEGVRGEPGTWRILSGFEVHVAVSPWLYIFGSCMEIEQYASFSVFLLATPWRIRRYNWSLPGLSAHYPPHHIAGSWRHSHTLSPWTIQLLFLCLTCLISYSLLEVLMISASSQSSFNGSWSKWLIVWSVTQQKGVKAVTSLSHWPANVCRYDPLNWYSCLD